MHYYSALSLYSLNALHKQFILKQQTSTKISNPAFTSTNLVFTKLKQPHRPKRYIYNKL